MLINKVEEMDKLRITFYCMACNTGHLLINKIKRKTDKPFISLVEELPKYIRKQKIKKVGLLATPTTIKTRLYEQVLEEYGIEVILPKNRDIELLGNIIKETIAGKNMDQNKVTVQHIARRLLKRGAEAIVESCTEIPLIFPKQHLIPVFDTLEILSEAVLKKYYSGTI
jgi:aspartate racemase